VIAQTPKGMETDHRNRNGLDNQRCNLRVCSHQQNQRNKVLSNVIYKGVCLDKRCNKFRARVRIREKQIYLGAFDSSLEAALAYDAAAREHFGEFARLNFPN